MSEVILKFNNVTNAVVDSAMEINCIVDLVKTDRQFVLKPIENIFDGAQPRMVRRAEDQTVAVTVDQIAHIVVFVRNQIVAQKCFSIIIRNVRDDVLQESNSVVDRSTSFDLKLKPSMTLWIARYGHGACVFLAMAVRPCLIQILPNEHLAVGPVGSLQKDSAFVPVDQILSIRVGYSIWVILVLVLVELCNVLR